MFWLKTKRLYLIQTPLEVVQRRLETDEFNAQLSINGEVLQVHFPPEWPGDPLAFFPMWAEFLAAHPDTEDWGGIIVSCAERVAVGQMGFKGLPDETGTIELGYGVNPAYQGRGYASEMAKALVDWAWTQPNVHRILADCRTDNWASIRVLEKVGFVRTGTSWDEDDGDLIVWEHRP